MVDSNTINYAKKCLKEQKETKLRGDYKEFSEIVNIFLGAITVRIPPSAMPAKCPK